VCAPGNKADVAEAELLAWLRDDPATRVICCYLESLPSGRAFVDEARLTTPTKPVVVCLTGRSPAGARAALSHTAALAGHDRVVSAALEQAGVVEVRSGLALLDAARALDGQPAPAGDRVAIVTNSGGTGVELADLLAAEGLQVPELSGALQAELAATLPAGASARNPVDITPVWSRFAELYPAMVERLARSGEVDAVIPVLLQRSAADPAVAGALRAAVARLRADGVTVPVLVCWVAPRSARPNADLLQEAGIPCFEWPERTARAAAIARRAALVSEAAGAPLGAAAPATGAGERERGGTVLDPERGAKLLHGVGIATVAGEVCASAAAAAEAAGRLGFPVVVKVVHPQLVHKSDAGGVRTGVGDAAAVRVAAGELLALADGARVLVQRQAEGLEVVVGGLRHAGFGAVVMAGLGGVLVEVLGDVVFALAPLDEREALRRLRGLRGWAVLAGARGREPVDAGALARTVVAAGELLVAHPEIVELDLNPLFATAGGCVAADWRIVVDA
jgi:acetyltransferase